jgi:hypothetical protein
LAFLDVNFSDVLFQTTNGWFEITSRETQLVFALDFFIGFRIPSLQAPL